MITITPKQDYDCDVLIIGGGPSGSGLAFHLASKGIRVIVAEAEKFPRDKVCGDGVSPIAVNELHKMGITEIAKFKEANEITQVGLFINEDKVYIDLSKPEYLPLHARVIPRLVLDNLIFETAKNAGAEYLENTRFVRYIINKETAITTLKSGDRSFEICSKVLVGADGSSSAVARQLHGSKSSDQFQLLGLRAYYEEVKGQGTRGDIFFSKESFPGIYWMFPRGNNGANIGMAMVSATIPHRPSNVKQMLQKHIENNKEIVARIGHGRQEGKILGWPITFFNASSKISGNRIMLLGDAAGLINPLSGDGIQYALLSARWASEVLEDCVNKNNFSENQMYIFRKKVEQELAYDFAFSHFLVQFARNKHFSKLWMEIIATLVGRAKKDKKYADTIAGIFEGTYPSYNALTMDFIIKSLLQGGVRGVDALDALTKNPKDALDFPNQFLTAMIELLKRDNFYVDDQLKWLSSVINKGLSVAGHTLNHVLSKKQ